MCAKRTDGAGDVSESQIAVHWKEEELVSPSKEFVAQANMTDEAASANGP